MSSSERQSYARLAQRTTLAMGTALLLWHCSSTPPPLPENAEAVGDLYIVDCLLPGQVRQLGNTRYLTPRRPISTTAGDCRIRGGEYTAYDRADYKTALKVWLPAAESGDPEAQNAVGEIFERGLGTEPNYELAAVWFKRAAEQGDKTAQFNLATLYETGRGVPQSKIEALNWYRRAWGISEDELVSRSEAEQALLAVADENAQLREQAAVAEQEASAARSSAEQARALLARARQGQERAESRERELREQIAAGGSFIGDAGAAAEQDRMPMLGPDPILRAGKSFGRYFALIIGNSNYLYLNDLDTPQADTDRLSQVLRDQYGFQVQRISNGDNAATLRALNALYDVLGEDDNLLIYYAGHGNRRASGSYDAGYWLPVNAEPPPNDTYWLPTEQVAGHLARLKARRIMVVADSAFAGLLADNPAFLLANDPQQLRSEAYVSLRMPNRARLLMTSGVDAPVPRLRAGHTSVFADAFIEALRRNDGVLTAPALFLDLLDELAIRQPELDPEFKAIKRAGDEVGDFFFVARS